MVRSDTGALFGRVGRCVEFRQRNPRAVLELAGGKVKNGTRVRYTKEAAEKMNVGFRCQGTVIDSIGANVVNVKWDHRSSTLCHKSLLEVVEPNSANETDAAESSAPEAA
jgi:hypothetical protein